MRTPAATKTLLLALLVSPKYAGCLANHAAARGDEKLAVDDWANGLAR